MPSLTVPQLGRLPLLLAVAAAVPFGLGLNPVLAQSRCYQVVSYTPPNMLRCQQIGEDYLRRPIWLCC
jgi:hypothetical protein